MVDYYFIGTIYEGIIILISVLLVSLSLSNHIKVRNRLSLLLFLILLSYGASIFFSWLSKVLNTFSNIDYIIYETVPDPNTLQSWFFLRIADFRITYVFIIIAIFFSYVFKGKIFEKKIKKINKYIVQGFTLFNLIFALLIFQKENDLFDVFTFFFVFILMIVVYLPFLLNAIKAFKSTDHPSFRKSFLYLSIMSLSYISVLLCLLIDRIFILFGHFGFTIFYFLTWVFVLVGIISTYYGYLGLDIK